ncbi:MAG: hypothetical protein ACR2FV_11365 [Ornithinimicrobium sp.]|uniref:hypothetical protein n=1 Tax=Ornithinimicrobium sp. TaxID=1977084 RepID=UPI003D9B0C4E
MTASVSPRQAFATTAVDLLDHRADVAVAYAEISGQYLEQARRRHPDRVLNVGIREQLLVSVGAGLALSGLRPIVHTFATFLVERAFEQIKLDFASMPPRRWSRSRRCCGRRWPTPACTTSASWSRPTPSPTPVPGCTSYAAERRRR